MIAGLSVRVWWGERLLDQAVVAAGHGLPCAFARRWELTLLPSGRHLRGPLEIDVRAATAPEALPRHWREGSWREWVVPIALLACLLSAMVVAVVPLHRSVWVGPGHARAGRGTLDGARRAVRVWETATARGEQRALSPRPPPLVRAAQGSVAPRLRARGLVEEIFKGATEVTFASQELKSALAKVSSPARLTASPEAGLGGRATSGQRDLEPLELGSLRTRGRGGGDDGYGRGLVAGRKPTVIVDFITEARVLGALDRSLIAKVMQAHRAELRYCYEYALTTAPHLKGRVTAKFVIDATGLVASAAIAESTVGNAELERCIVGRVRTFRFPASAGGGIVVVNYPWEFSTAGAE